MRASTRTRAGLDSLVMARSSCRLQHDVLAKIQSLLKADPSELVIHTGDKGGKGEGARESVCERGRERERARESERAR